MKNIKQKSRNVWLALPLAVLVFSCDDHEGDIPTDWELEVEQLRVATTQYADIDVAISEGFFDASGFVPNMGHHYLLPSRVDDTFVLEEPEIILYAPDANGNMEFVAVEYVVPIADLDNPGLPPEGFTGDLDEWEINERLSQWQLHVWIVKANPDGIFAPTNPRIGNGN